MGCINNPAGNDENGVIIGDSLSWLIKINNYYCFIDEESKTMLFPIDSININEFSGIIEFSEEYYNNIYLNDILVVNGENFNFGNVTVGDTIQVTLNVDAQDVIYNLLFTTLPTVLILTEENIVDEPKISSRLIINDLLEDKLHDTSAGIEIIGGTSQNYPKVSYTLELWEDESGLDIKKEELFGLRNDDDWNLDAMYIDLSRSRNILGMKTWASFARAAYLIEEDEARLYQRGHLVEVFLNNVYLGLYSFNEQIDRQQLDLKKNGGILYKSESWTSETTYEEIQIAPDSSLYWSGFELKHPEEMNVVNWEPLYNFIHLVAYADNSTFIDSIQEMIDMENIIDYFLFINLIQANDNTGKNMFICRYDEDYPLIFVPWDLDLTFGNTNSIWTSDIPNDYLLTNNFYNRLYALDVNDYRNKVKVRWYDIYQSGLYDHIINDLTNNIYKIIDSNANYRDNTRWDLTTDYTAELDYVTTWINMRLIFFDNFISINY